jgi:hypothetical protein
MGKDARPRASGPGADARGHASLLRLVPQQNARCAPARPAPELQIRPGPLRKGARPGTRDTAITAIHREISPVDTPERPLVASCHAWGAQESMLPHPRSAQVQAARESNFLSVVISLNNNVDVRNVSGKDWLMSATSARTRYGWVANKRPQPVSRTSGVIE